MPELDAFRSVSPSVAPGGEDHENRRVLEGSQSGSLLDREARELLGRFEHDKNLPRSVRDRAARALNGNGTLRDVLEEPEFARMREAAAAQFREELSSMGPEERDQVMRTLKERFSGPFGMPSA